MYTNSTHKLVSNVSGGDYNGRSVGEVKRRVSRSKRSRFVDVSEVGRHVWDVAIGEDFFTEEIRIL